MKVKIFDSKEELFYAGAWQFMHYALAHPDGLIGLCTGSTTNPIHQIIMELYKSSPFDTSKLKTVNADEYVSPKGLEKPLTMRPAMQPFFDVLGLDEERGMFPDHLAADTDAECLRYEQRIRDAGGVGLQLLGIGPDAHLGFCLPGTPLDAITHTTQVSDAIEKLVNNHWGVPSEYGPFIGYTMGPKTFMQGRYIIPLTVGTVKAEAVEKSILGPISTDWPASVLQFHPNVVWYMDREAAEGVVDFVEPDGSLRSKY